MLDGRAAAAMALSSALKPTGGPITRALPRRSRIETLESNEGRQIVIMHCPHCGEAITKSDRRGAPKITRGFIVDAFEKLGGGATLAQIARELGVTERALQKWAKRQGYTGWADVKRSTVLL